MNCFEFRRLVLVDPRDLSSAAQAHAAQCSACSGLSREMNVFESRIHDALSVPAPDALADRILLRHKVGRPARITTLAIAASLILTTAIILLFYREAPTERLSIVTASELGALHPAVAAISYVVDHEPRLLLESRSADPAIMRAALHQMGITLPRDVRVRYLGKCPVPGGTGEHVVLETRLGHVTLILAPEQRIDKRVVVTNRNMAAIAAPARKGSFIVVTDTPAKAMAIEHLLL